MKVREYNKQVDQKHSLRIYSSSSAFIIDLPFIADLPFIVDLAFTADLALVADLPLLPILRGDPRSVCAD